MQILARYIASVFFKNLVLALLGLTGLFFFQSVLTQANDFTWSQRIIMNLYDLPSMLVMVTPPAALLATVLTFSGMSKTNELIACYSIGISIRQMMGVIFPIVFVLGCVSLVLQDRILPAFNEKKNAFYWKEIKQRQDFYLDVKQEKIWYRSNRFIYHLKNFDAKNEKIIGIGVYLFDEAFHLVEQVQAKEASYNGDSWELRDGKNTHFDQKTGFPISETFKSRLLKLKESPKDFKMIEREVDRLRIKDLIRFIRSNKQSGIDSKSFEVRLHSRFALSFIPIIMFLLAVPFAISRARDGRTGRDLLIAFVITFFYWLGYSVSLSLGQNGTIPPVIAAWLPSAVFGVLALFLLKRMEV
jgi:lipopolysaccharide export system permease protein